MVCELVPLFDVAQPTLSHHLKRLRDAGMVDSERMAELSIPELRQAVRARYAAGV